MTHETVTQLTGMPENAHSGKQDTDKDVEKCDMSPEETINELFYTLYRADYSRRKLRHYKKSFDIAKTAIERSLIAKKPKEEKVYFDCIPETGIRCACPSCGAEIDGLDEPPYCQDCGQKMMWEDADWGDDDEPKV